MSDSAEIALDTLKLGEKLIQRGLVTQDEVDIALIEQKKTGKMIGQALTDLGFVEESDVRDILGEALGRESVDLDNITPDVEALQIVPKQLAQRHTVLPISFDAETDNLTLAMADIFDVMILDRIQANIPANINVTPVIATETDIKDAIDEFYGYEMSLEGILKEFETGVVDYQSVDPDSSEFSQPIVRLVNAFLSDAVKRDASDIHFEPEPSFLRLRYRIDGVMLQIRSLHKDYWPPISVRLKVMAGLNIAENRVPQDGRFSLRVSGRPVDFRVSVLPTVNGENIVLRILDRSRGLVPLEEINLHPSSLEQLKLLMSRPEGIILVTGPTGSGKTTTLYSMLSFLNTPERNIMTLEDPVEYPIDMIRQTSVGEVAKMDFADGIRSIMRQDPDIILVGEIRDSDTAEMAFRAAMTGHQVFTTLHTNSAIGALPRLIDIGVTPEIMAGNIIGIVGQRLVRVLCRRCKVPRLAEEFEQIILGVGPDQELYDPVGCPRCNGIGYKRRNLVMEILPMNAELDEMISAGASMMQLLAKAREDGYKLMADDGIRQVISGETTIEELSRVIDLTVGLK